MLNPSTKKYSPAFGLIEVLISITIIAIIMAALVGIARMVLTNTVQTQEKSQAVRLAQEGIEIVRQVRDTGWIDRDNTTEWDTWVYNSGTWSASNGDFEIAFNSTVPTDSSYNRYYLQSTSGDGALIVLDGSNFYRKVRVENVTNLVPGETSTGSGVSINTYAKKVTVTVLEPSGKTVAISEIMTNWRPNY